MTVREVDGTHLKVAVGRVGTIDAADVIAADKADAHFTGIIDKNPQDAAALLARGKYRFMKGDNDATIADLDQSLKLAPSADGYVFRGFAWKRKGDLVRAMADIEEAIKLNPNESLAWRVRGAAWASKAEYAKALADYTESIRIDPENADSLHHRAVLLSGCEDPKIRDGKQAVKDATKACELSEWKEPLYLSGLGFAYSESGNFDAAIKWQQKAIDASPASNGARLMYGRIEDYRQKKPFRTTWR